MIPVSDIGEKDRKKSHKSDGRGCTKSCRRSCESSGGKNSRKKFPRKAQNQKMGVDRQGQVTYNTKSDDALL